MNEIDEAAKVLEELDVPPLRLNGRLAVPPHVEYARDLTEADLVALSLPRGSKPKSLLRIHASHHSLARCLATGMKMNQAALVTGYSEPRVYALMQDPSFTALIADYQAEAKSVVADMTARMQDISLDAMELLQEQMHDHPEQMTVPVLLDIVKAFADRTGHGPNQEVNLKVSTVDTIDRPPRETVDEWKARRARELLGPTDDSSMESSAGTPNGGHNGRLVS